jgi:hypothetical protein
MNLLEPEVLQGCDLLTPLVEVDLVCINQGDLQERASQVNIMKQIYKGANKVIVWLGPRTENADLALDLLQKLSSIRKEKAKFGPYGVILREDLSKAGLPDFLISSSRTGLQ